MNCYATLADVKSRLGITATTYDTELLAVIEAASRLVDQDCYRYFYTETATKYYDGEKGNLLDIDDCLSITTLSTDTEDDGTYDGETWTENTDFYLYPRNHYPKQQVGTTGFGDYSFAASRDYVKIVGVFGYGNGTANPWTATAITVTVGTTTGTSLTLSAEGTIKAGHTIKCGTEQMFVTAVSSDNSKTATVKRGVNGTTAATQAAATASIALYPEQVITAATMYALEIWNSFDGAGYTSERIGDYYYTRSESMISKAARNLTSNLQRLRV